MVQDGLTWHLAGTRLLLAVVSVGNWNAGFSSFRRLTWASFCTWRQGSKSLIAEAVELLKAQIWDVHDIISAKVYYLKPLARSGHIPKVGK